MTRTDIVQLIGSYVPLKKKGNTHWGCCPFHLEKTPSFTVSESKQLYYCFGCQEGGNALTFLKKIESIETMDAAKILASQTGIEMPSFSFNKPDGEDYEKKRDRVYELLKEAATFYHKALNEPQAVVAREYLENRKIDKSLVTRFGLGYSTDSRAVITHLKGLGFSEAEMKDAGLIEISAKGAYDVFFERLIIPIINAFKQVVGFGGRTLKPNPDFAKYRNSTQTIVFDKSKLVYGINLLKAQKLKEGKLDYIIMTEGYMDVIMLHKAGFTTAVASMGTALTLNQAKQLKNYCDKIYISYDGDSAGQKSTLRGLDILAEAGLNVKVVSLPEGLDPDDVIKKLGRDHYQKLLIESKTLTSYKIDSLKKQYDLEQSDEKAKFAVEAVEVIKKLDNPIEREEYLKIIQSYTGYTMNALLAQANIKTAEREVPTYSIEKASEKSKLKTAATDTKIQKAETYVLAMMAQNAEYVDWSIDENEVFINEISKNIFVQIRNCILEKRYDLSVLYTMFEAETKLLNQIVNYEPVAGDGVAKYAKEINALKIEKLELEAKQLYEELAKTNSMELFLKKSEIDKRIQELKNGEN